MSTSDADLHAAPGAVDPVATEVADVARALEVDPAHGLTAAQVQERLASTGPNRLAEGKTESGYRAFLRQYEDFMQVVLLVAAAVNQIVTGETGTTVVLAGLTVFNAVIGLRQEAKAEESVKALAQMMRTVARVRRDGQSVEIDADGLVPGDVVLVEAGNLVPADARVYVAASLEIEEAALTGESLPVGKSVEPVLGDDIPLGDRTCMAYMNTSVTRGRGELIVTATGMATEIGHIADMLASTSTSKTPLQKQLDGLSKIIATIAAIALVLVILLGLARGESFDTLFVTGVALAVAAIPTGLPAVVTALLSMGTREIAQRNAIVKRLPAVETLGSTSAICSDKTGTLTLNKMTARELVIPGQNRFTVSGEGYSTEGEIKHVGGQHFDLDPYLLPTVLCADALLDGETLIGDPTEGALIVLGAKGGLDITETRAALPRVAEVPFDSDYKFMATFHEMKDANGQPDPALLRQGSSGRPHRPSDERPQPRRVAAAAQRRQPTHRPRDQRSDRERRRAGHGRGSARPGPRHPAHRWAADRPGPGSHPARDDRHRRPPSGRGQGCDRRVPRRRHQGPDDHRRPRHHGRSHRRRARHRGQGGDRSRVRRHG